MAAPQITALPTPPNRADSPDTFSARGDAFLAALPTFRTEANAQADYTDARVTAAFNAGLEDAAANAGAAASNAEQTALDRASATDSSTSANAGREQAQIAAESASASLNATLAAASLSGAKAYATLTLANADLGSLVADQVVFIADIGSYCQYNGAALVFLRAQEYYPSPSPAVASDSVQNMISKLLVFTGVIPATSPSADLVF